MTREHNHGKSGMNPLFLLRKPKWRRILFRILCFVVFALSVVWLLGYGIYCLRQNMSTRNTQKELQDKREEADIYKDTEAGEENSSKAFLKIFENKEFTQLVY